MTDMKDWPQTLVASAQARALAHALYFWRCTAYGQPRVPWCELPYDARRTLIDFATVCLMALEPDVKPSKQTTSVLFQLAADLARGEAQRLRAARVVQFPEGA